MRTQKPRRPTWRLVGLAAGAAGLIYWQRRQHRTAAASTPLDLALLACPRCHGPLAARATTAGDVLVCAACEGRYPLVDGIPHLWNGWMYCLEFRKPGA